MHQSFSLKISLFTEAEKEAIRKEYSYVRKSANGTDTNTLFTEQNIDSTQNELTKNASTKSVILAPFNRTQNSFSGFNEDYVLEKNKVIKFAAKVRDFDRQYEKNNNGDLDNGVYNQMLETNNKKSFDDSNDSLESSFEEGGEPQNSKIFAEDTELVIESYKIGRAHV